MEDRLAYVYQLGQYDTTSYHKSSKYDKGSTMIHTSLAELNVQDSSINQTLNQTNY